jgi:thymidylate synthase (FAD)
MSSNGCKARKPSLQFAMLNGEHAVKKSIEIYGDGIGRVDLVEWMGNDLTIVNSARVSFGKHKETLEDEDRRLINYLVRHRHTSTFEHNVVTFRFAVPLFVRSQHHRHRTWSYNEISRRYTDLNIQFYEPHAFRTQHKSNRQASNADELIDPPVEAIFQVQPNGYQAYAGEKNASQALKAHHKQSLALYEALMQAGVCREQARGVLPQNLYTEYYGTTNANNLLKFIDLRTHEGAQWEIQKVAEACLEIAEGLWPVAVSSYRRAKKLRLRLEGLRALMKTDEVVITLKETGEVLSYKELLGLIDKFLESEE